MSDAANRIAELRRRLAGAENAGDAETVVSLLTDDVVAMVPNAPPLEGRDACARFSREMLAELVGRFERVVRYHSDEVGVHDDLAWDRGTFMIETVSRADGVHERASGKYLWLLRRDGGEWQIARLIHAIDEPEEKAPEALVSSRLRLERPRHTDAPEIFARYASDPAVTRYLAWPTHTTVADTEMFVMFSDQEWRRAPAGPYLIRARDDGRVLGSTGFAFDGRRRATTGYVLARDAWGQGYATEALRAMVAIAGTLGVARLQAVCHADHAASRHVLEKCGFRVDEAVAAQAEFPNLESQASRQAVTYVIEPPPINVDLPLP